MGINSHTLFGYYQEDPSGSILAPLPEATRHVYSFCTCTVLYYEVQRMLLPPHLLGSLSGGPDLAFSSGTQNPSRACKRSQRLTTRSRSPVGQDCAHRRTCETRLAFLFLEARLRNLSSSLD